MVKISNFKPFPILPGSFHIYNKPYIPCDVSPIVNSTDLEASRAAHATSRGGRTTPDHSGVLSGAPHRGGHQAEGGRHLTLYTVNCTVHTVLHITAHYTLYNRYVPAHECKREDGHKADHSNCDQDQQLKPHGEAVTDRLG